MARKEKAFSGYKPRRIQDVVEERDRERAILKNYGTGPRVTMEWNLNPEAIQDQIFKLTIGDKEAYLDAEEVRRFLRWV